MTKIVEYNGQNIYIPSYGLCFTKCITCFTIEIIREKLRKSLAKKNIDQWL